MTAVLAAAGSGERLGAGGPKAFVELAGRPMIEWSLDAFRAAGVGSIVVAMPPGTAGLPDGSAIYDATLPAYNLMVLSASRTFFKSHLDVTAGVKNVMDVQTLSPTSTSSGTAHSSNGGGNLLPRRLFVTLRVAL